MGETKELTSRRMQTMPLATRIIETMQITVTRTNDKRGFKVVQSNCSGLHHELWLSVHVKVVVWFRGQI